jgi:hypothetical protein
MLAAAMDMDSTERTKPSPPPRGTSRPAGEPVPDPFDVWLQRGLHQLYDSVAAEPIPPELLQLIEADQTRRQD